MAAMHGSKARVHVNGVDLSAYLRQIGVAGAANTAETSTFGKTAKTYLAGLRDATLSAEGYFDGDVNAVDDRLSNILGTGGSIWTVLLQGDVAGNAGYGLSAIETSYEATAPIAGAVEVTAAAQSTVGREPVRVLQPYGGVTATGNGVTHDNGAATTAGGAMYVQSGGINGGSSSTFRIEHSVDNITFVTLASVTGAQMDGYRVAISGTINRYTRARHELGVGVTQHNYGLSLHRAS